MRSRGRDLLAVAAVMLGATAGAAWAQGGTTAAAAATQRRLPNEVGRVPILMYHSIGDRGKFDALGLNIPAKTFRKHLELLHAAGCYPVNMRDALSARLDVPAGKIPVVLTFDDARLSQFRYLKGGRIDPECAVGILERFHAEHPDDWPLRASFYILPDSKYAGAPFGQKGLAERKIRHLVAQGFEVANHSTTHHSMAHQSRASLEREVAECVRWTKSVEPGATMDTFALPYGAKPTDPSLMKALLSGESGGTTYTNKCVLLAGGDPALPFLHKRFDNVRITRMGSAPGYIEAWVKRLEAGEPYQPYVSDGDPTLVTVPKSALARVDRSRLEGARLLFYDDPARAPVAAKRSRRVAVKTRR